MRCPSGFHGGGRPAEPKVKVFLVDFADSAVIYEIKFYMGNHARINEINDAVRTNVWYELKRQGITIPFPIRHIARGAQTSRQCMKNTRKHAPSCATKLCLSACQISKLTTAGSNPASSHFGRGERVIREGGRGDSMFVLLRGSAEVSISKNGTSIPVATLKAPDCFRRIVLFSPANVEPRRCAPRPIARSWSIGKPVMAELLRASPDCLERLSELLAQRKMETEGFTERGGFPQPHERKEREYKAPSCTVCGLFLSCSTGFATQANHRGAVIPSRAHGRTRRS